MGLFHRKDSVFRSWSEEREDETDCSLKRGKLNLFLLKDPTS